MTSAKLTKIAAILLIFCLVLSVIPMQSLASSGDTLVVTGAGDAVTVPVGGTLQMSATKKELAATIKSITWSIKPMEGTGAGTAVIDQAGLLTGTGVGAVVVTATANNNMTGSITVTIVHADPSAPAIMPIKQINVTIGDAVVIPVMSTNPKKSMMLTYGTAGAPSDASMTKEGVLYWIPKAAGTYQFSVTVNDMMSPTVAAPVTVTVTPSRKQAPPVIQPIALGLVKKGTTISYNVVTFDVNGDLVNYALVNAPAGAEIDKASGVMTWTPSAAGHCTFSVSASDGVRSVAKAVNITVVTDYDVITRWNMETLAYIGAKGIANQYGSRTLAMMHTAMFDAVNSVNHEYMPYFTYQASPAASPEAAAAAAAYTVLAALYPADQTVFGAVYNEQMAAISNGQPKMDGIALGQTTAMNILNLRSSDKSANANTPYPDGTQPGQYRKTGMNPMLPGWGNVTPWVLTSGSQFRLAGPPTLTSARYTAAYNETKNLGARNSTVRTTQQSEDALFWIGGVPDHWFGIAREMSAKNNLTLIENARLLALLSTTLADASIAGWDTKYTFGFWRPVTAIWDGELDGNSMTVGDTAWQPFISTPAFPEYGSGHSTTCGAGAALLSGFFGTDDAIFTRMSTTPGLPAHEYASFSEVAQEAGASRIPAGVHFQFSNQEALVAGSQIGNYVYMNAMRPLT